MKLQKKIALEFDFGENPEEKEFSATLVQTEEQFKKNDKKTLFKR